MSVNHEIILPEFFPKTWNKDFPHGYGQPIHKALLTLPPAYSFYPVYQPAKCTLNRIRCQWDPASNLKPVIKNNKRIPIEVFHIGSGLRIFLRRKNLDQFLKPLLDLFNKLHHKLFFWFKYLLQQFFCQRKKQDIFHKLPQRLLFFFFQPILIKKKRKVSLPMPGATLLSHTFGKQILFNTRFPIREKHFQFPIIQSLLQILADRRPGLVYPKTDRLKPLPHILTGKNPSHRPLCPTETPLPSCISTFVPSAIRNLNCRCLKDGHCP